MAASYTKLKNARAKRPKPLYFLSPSQPSLRCHATLPTKISLGVALRDIQKTAAKETTVFRYQACDVLVFDIVMVSLTSNVYFFFYNNSSLK